MSWSSALLEDLLEHLLGQHGARGADDWSMMMPVVRYRPARAGSPRAPAGPSPRCRRRRRRAHSPAAPRRSSTRARTCGRPRCDRERQLLALGEERTGVALHAEEQVPLQHLPRDVEERLRGRVRDRASASRTSTLSRSPGTVSVCSGAVRIHSRVPSRGRGRGGHGWSALATALATPPGCAGAGTHRARRRMTPRWRRMPHPPRAHPCRTGRTRLASAAGATRPASVAQMPPRTRLAHDRTVCEGVARSSRRPSSRPPATAPGAGVDCSAGFFGRRENKAMVRA